MRHDAGMEPRAHLPSTEIPPNLIERSDEVLGGTLVFAGTRVPVQTLLDYLESGDSVDEFVADFPSVQRDHAVAVLEVAGRALLAHVP